MTTTFETRRMAGAVGAAPAPAVERQPGRSRHRAAARRSRPAVSLPARPRGVTLVVLVALGLSLLGFVYLLQISRVASYGYQLAKLQHRQAELDRENELLLYRVSEERSLARVDDLARRDYGMQPLDPGKLPEPTATAGGTTGQVKPASKAVRARFVAVQRPPAAPPTPVPPPRQPASALDRLWERIVGIGVAGTGAR